MKNFHLIVAVCLALFCSLSVTAQTKKTDVNTDVDIVKVYEQVVKEGYPTLEIYKELAMAQYFRSNYKEAKKWFEKWFDLEMPKDAAAKHRYKQTLRALKVSAKNNKYLAVATAARN
ncbi:hypothetical protein G5B37_08080 [Rasiella rasia]|uniref:Uncharacterized protein n=1 Tax=Rasiella rasia TaxID=2744027 RepID=A0A6G6GP85_9FLAO|nr:hypothetical protein [Rasiella rasia]QIE59521.1 hypothetical protein G5B37_08080 [Rasiella rasia]